MTYEDLLTRHKALLRAEAEMAQRIKGASGKELVELERQLRRVAMESDAVFDMMLTVLERDRKAHGSGV